MKTFLVAALALSLASGGCTRDPAVRVHKFDVSLAVNSDGSVDVTEHVTMKLTRPVFTITRILAVRLNIPGRPVRMLKISDLSATAAEGEQLRVDAWYTGRSTIQTRIWIAGGLDANRDVIIRYHVENAIPLFKGPREGDFDELYWNANANGMAAPIGKTSVVVALPAGVAPTRTAVYTGDSYDNALGIGLIKPAGSVAPDAKIATNGNKVAITLDRPLSQREGMIIDIRWPAGHIRPLEPAATGSRR